MLHLADVRKIFDKQTKEIQRNKQTNKQTNIRPGMNAWKFLALFLLESADELSGGWRDSKKDAPEGMLFYYVDGLDTKHRPVAPHDMKFLDTLYTGGEAYLDLGLDHYVERVDMTNKGTKAKTQIFLIESFLRPERKCKRNASVFTCNGISRFLKFMDVLKFTNMEIVSQNLHAEAFVGCILFRSQKMRVLRQLNWAISECTSSDYQYVAIKKNPTAQSADVDTWYSCWSITEGLKKISTSCNSTCSDRYLCGSGDEVALYHTVTIRPSRVKWKCLKNKIRCETCPRGYTGRSCELRDCSRESGACGDYVCESATSKLRRYPVCVCADNNAECSVPALLNAPFRKTEIHPSKRKTTQSRRKTSTVEIMDKRCRLCERLSTVCRSNPGTKKKKRTYSCSCRPGFVSSPDPNKCLDVDECKEKIPCDKISTICINVVASFNCICKDGFRKIVDQNKCRKILNPLENVTQNVAIGKRMYYMNKGDAKMVKLGAHVPEFQYDSHLLLDLLSAHYVGRITLVLVDALNKTVSISLEHQSEAAGKLMACPEISSFSYDCKGAGRFVWIANLDQYYLESMRVEGFELYHEMFAGCYESMTSFVLKANHFSEAMEYCRTTEAKYMAIMDDLSYLCTVNLEFLIQRPASSCHSVCNEMYLCGSGDFSAVYKTEKKSDVVKTPECVFQRVTCAGCSPGLMGLECDIRDCSVDNGSCPTRICHTVSSGLISYSTCYCGRIGFSARTGEFCPEESCDDDNLCDEQTTVCTEIHSLVDFGLDRTYRCDCREGYDKLPDDPRMCHDIDECAKLPCPGVGVQCTNTFGSYRCTCKLGFQSTETRDCMDVDECLDKPCHVQSTICINVPGSFKCSCLKGLRKADNFTCTDMDECEGDHVCDLGKSVCSNFHGGYFCPCFEAYEQSTNFTCSAFRQSWNQSQSIVAGVDRSAGLWLAYAVFAILTAMVVAALLALMCFLLKENPDEDFYARN